MDVPVNPGGDHVDQQTVLELGGVRIEMVDLGRLAYAEALAEQRHRQKAVIEARGTECPRMDLLFVEHDPPVITVSNRPGARDHLLADEHELARRGVEVSATDRGGDITLHAPGQIVVYPILDLNRLDLRLHGYLRWLEEIVIRSLSRFEVIGHRDPDATGVWVGENPSRKICALGVRVSRWVTMHGLALNVSPDLSLFELIVPCGLAGRDVTSLQAELGDVAPASASARNVLREEFSRAIADLLASPRA